MARFKIRFLCSEMTEPELRVCHPLQVFIIDWLLILVNQTQLWKRLKVPFAVTRHIFAGEVIT